MDSNNIMAKYDVVQKVNGNLIVVSTWEDNKNSAFQAFHDRCKLLYSDPETTKAVVAILDDNLELLEGKKEFINKT